ncbi:MAG: SDR family NAD(P)-dependent oxidoreductase [Candidatus Eisenbacteria bacterium]
MSVRRVWITGAGRGIGRAAAERFAEAGWMVYMSARTESDLEEGAVRCRVAGPGARVLPLDVRDARAVAAAAAVIEGEGGPPDALFLSAGVGSFGPVAETDPAEWERILAVNLSGTFHCMRYALPGMIRRGSGKIILVSSIAARIALPGAAAYSASKAGVQALANSAREELRGTGVRVSVITAGATASPFWDTVESDLDRNRMLPPRTVAEAALRLAEEPPEGTTEELVLLPPDGLL